MGIYPRRICPSPGCTNTVPSDQHGGRCIIHAPIGTWAYKPPFQGAVRTADRADKNLYQTSRWHKAARTHIEHHPACVLCGEPATTVDHDPPHDGTAATFWNTATWQSLCAACHSRKSGRAAALRRWGKA